MKNSEAISAMLKLTLDKTDNEDVNLARAKAHYKLLKEGTDYIVHELKKEQLMKEPQFAKNHREITD